MTQFNATIRSDADVRASRDQIWAVLTDPALVAKLTPFVTGIDGHGERWTWHMSEIRALGARIRPTFTERMTFTDRRRIDFVPAEVQGERIGASGRYEITDAADGVHLAMELTVTADLPLPRASSPAVTRVMRQTMQRMGDRFAGNLCRDLGYC